MAFNFPDVDLALKEPNGLLAVGGNLSSETLIDAYTKGIFPWFSAGEQIKWWSPDPRAVLCINSLHLSTKTKQFIKKNEFKLTINYAFDEVITSCARKKNKKEEIWITDEMIIAYKALHSKNYAHSFEVWKAGELIGGLYGVAIGNIFSGESMFSNKTEASKIALLFTCAQIYKMGFKWLDCQVMNDHLSSMGAISITRNDFKKNLIDYKSTQDNNINPEKFETFWPNTKKLFEYYISKKKNQHHP